MPERRALKVLIAGHRCGLSGSDTVLEVDPVSGRHPKQIGGTPDHVVFELTDLAVGVDQLPHHFDNAPSAGLIHRTHDDAGEMIEINRLTLDQHRRRDQLVRRSRIKPEAAFDQAVKFALFGFGRFAVNRNDVNQQRRRGQTIPGIVECPMRVCGGINAFKFSGF